MDEQTFIRAIEQMGSLPPLHREQLLKLAPLMSDKDRAKTLKKLTPMVAKIKKQQHLVLSLADEGIKEVQHARKTILPKMHQEIEQAEHSAAEHIFDDDSTNS